MNSINNLNETAKNSVEPALKEEERAVVLLESIEVHLSSLARRFDFIEKRLGHLDRAVHRVLGAGPGAGEEEALSEPDAEPLAPPYALRCDGRVLLSTRGLEDIDLSGRETFTSIVLSEAEVSDALERVTEAFEEAAAKSAEWIRRKGKGCGSFVTGEISTT